MKGVYQHRRKRHFHRFAAKFEFRYNNQAANEPEDQKRTHCLDVCVWKETSLPGLTRRVEPAPEA